MKLIKHFMTGVIAGIIISIALTLIFSLLMVFFDMPSWGKTLVTSLTLCLGAFTAGVFASRLRGHAGLTTGIITSGMLFFLLFAIGFVFIYNAVTVIMPIRLFMMLISGAIGGVSGVNMRKKRRK